MIASYLPIAPSNTYTQALNQTVSLGVPTQLTLQPSGLDYSGAAVDVPCNERFKLLIEKYNETTQQWEYYLTTYFQWVGLTLTADYILNDLGTYRYIVSIMNRCVRTDYIYTGITTAEATCELDGCWTVNQVCADDPPQEPYCITEPQEGEYGNLPQSRWCFNTATGILTITTGETSTLVSFSWDGVNYTMDDIFDPDDYEYIMTIDDDCDGLTLLIKGTYGTVTLTMDRV